MKSQNIYPLSLNGDTFNALKSDYDSMLRQTLSKMEDLKVEDATITIKVAVSLEKDQARDFRANGYDGMRDIVKPTFKHEISTVMQVKDKKSGSVGGAMELVWDQELGDYVMRPIDNGQVSMFDETDEVNGGTGGAQKNALQGPELPVLPGTSGEVIDADYEVVEDGRDGSDGHHADPKVLFEYMRQFIGVKMEVLEAMGNYTVRTESNKVVLTSANPQTLLYCSGAILGSHVGHKLVCEASGPVAEYPDTISIICEDCEETLFELHSPAWVDDEEGEVDDSGSSDDDVTDDYPYEDPGEEG